MPVPIPAKDDGTEKKPRRQVKTKAGKEGKEKEEEEEEVDASPPTRKVSAAAALEVG